MPGENVYDWSITAANNGNSDTSINWAEGQPRASVNNSARSMMAALAKQRDLLNGSIVTTGSANAQVFSSGLNFTSSIPTNFMARLKIGTALTNTGPATLSMDSVGSVIVVNQFGEALGPAEIVGDTIIDFVYDGTNWRLLTGLPGAGFSTGDVKTTFKITADIGWVMMDDGSIGNATSGATSRANADTVNLFTLLYDNITALGLQDPTGAAITRGADAASDYANSRRLVIPKILGRALAGAGSGASLTARALGSTAGEESHVLTVAEMPVHAHHTNNPGDAFTVTAGGTFNIGGGFFPLSFNGFDTSLPWQRFPNITADQGSGVAHNVIQPTSYLNVMIKL